jgi:NADH dehydrogenase FAD-containing subunit
VPTRILILGAGFGGLELATRLSGELAHDDATSITLVTPMPKPIPISDVVSGRHRGNAG